MFSNEVYTRTIAIRLDLYNRNLDKNYRKAYEKYYESCLQRQDSFANLIEAKKTFFALKVKTYSFTESELNALFANYNVINEAYKSLESSIELFKLTFDAYCRYM